MKIKRNNPLWLILSAVTLIFLLFTYLKTPSDAISLTFFDVGQGDAALAVTPSGQRILLDGGPDGSVIEGLGWKIPFYSRRLDVVIISHPHADHVSGLVEVAEKYNIGTVYLSGVTHTAPEYLALLEKLNEKGVVVRVVKAGDSLDLGNGIRLEFLFPLVALENKTVENLNDSSVVTRLSWGDSEAIFMGDLESDGQTQLLASGQNVSSDIIKISHHGSSDSVNAAFMSAVKPAYAVISVGADNKFGHPSKEMLNVLKNITIYRTDIDGDVSFDLTPAGVVDKM